MHSVKNEQINEILYSGPSSRYSIDNCLPQRQAIESGEIGFHALSHGHYPGTKIAPALLPGVPSIGYFDVVGAQDWGIPSHRNEGIEVCYQQTGESVLTVNGSVYRLTPKTFSLTRPWQLHSVGDPNLKAGRLYWMILDVGVRRPNQEWVLPRWCILTRTDQEELVQKLRGNEYPVWNASPLFGRIFGEIAQLLSAPRPEEKISNLSVQLNRLLLELLSLMRAQNIKTDDTLTTRRRAVQLFLDELKSDPDFIGHPWTLEQMAAHCGMKRTTFSEYCRELINTSPLEGLNRWRLAMAAERLSSETETSITSIALDVGYSSSQYFASKFKHRYGMSPRQWRNHKRAEQKLRE